MAGLTWVAAHRVIGEITRNRTAPRLISPLIQSCSLQAGAPSKYIFARNRMGSITAPMALSSAAMLERLINDTYLSVVAFGFRRASAKACSDAETTPKNSS